MGPRRPRGDRAAAYAGTPQARRARGPSPAARPVAGPPRRRRDSWACLVLDTLTGASAPEDVPLRRSQGGAEAPPCVLRLPRHWRRQRGGIHVAARAVGTDRAGAKPEMRRVHVVLAAGILLDLLVRLAERP